MRFILPCVASFILTVAITPLVIRCAKACNCLDIPGGRRLHKEETPRWGGVAFFAGVLPLLFIANGDGTLTSYIVASCLLVGMGVIDDRTSLGWKVKFAGMAAAATIVICGGDIVVRSLGTYGPLGQVDLGWFSIPFTFIGIIGITNAINLLDGLNGLAGGVSLLGFLFMGIAAALAGNLALALVCFAFVGALGAFLLYNFPNARIFMGDSGSLFLGFSLSTTAVLLTQDAASPVDPMFPFLVLLLPIFDTLRVLMVRLLSGSNPFRGDNLHLHFLIMEKNVSPANVTLLFWSLTAIFGIIALTLRNSTSIPYLGIVLYASLFLGMFAVSLDRKRHTRGVGRNVTPFRAGIRAYSSGLTRHYTAGQGIARKEGSIRFKWIVVLGVILLPAQTFAGHSADFRTHRDMSVSASSHMHGSHLGISSITASCRTSSVSGDTHPD